MAKVILICTGCGEFLRCNERARGASVQCPQCQRLVPVPPLIPKGTSRQQWLAKKKWVLRSLLALGIILLAIGVSTVLPTRFIWPDRRPIGVLFLASNYHSSPTNPRGWFNDGRLNFVDADGAQRFRQALFEYTDQSIANLKRMGAQGVIVWDLEGEEYPHKTTYIGDPRLVGRLAPEMAPVVDEFFDRLKSAGLRVGVTVRPQQLVFNEFNQPRQKPVFNLAGILGEKIDHARKQWGATLFFLDSNFGIWRPDEVWQLRRVAAQRPDILLIPEHHDAIYRAFSAPYVRLEKNDPGTNDGIARKLYPTSFQIVDISDATDNRASIDAARRRGDILLCRAWVWDSECELLEHFVQAEPTNETRAKMP